MIIGEIKRYLRDDGILKVSRSLKENCVRICRSREELEKRLGREPGVAEIAAALELPVETVVISMLQQRWILFRKLSARGREVISPCWTGCRRR